MGERSYFYTYAVVTGNGAGVHATFDSLPKAKAALPKIAEQWSLDGSVFEIERIRNFSDHSRQYDMRRRSRWVPWNPRVGPEEREPDWCVAS